MSRNARIGFAIISLVMAGASVGAWFNGKPFYAAPVMAGAVFVAWGVFLRRSK